MTKQPIKVGVFIGRFQPFHAGHASVISQALEKVDHLIIIIGSAFRARNTRNPFTVAERVAMIRGSFRFAVDTGKIIFRAVEDFPSDDRWEAEIRKIVKITSTVPEINPDADTQIFLCGHAKDHSSYYTQKFPEWDSIGIETPYHMISATSFREQYFNQLPIIVEKHLPAGTIDVLESFQHSEAFKWLLDYHEARRARDKAWAAAPFPPKDVCADAVVVQSGHILLVRRGKFPGKGLLALPGGHVNEFERIQDAAVRELKEETRIADPKGEIPKGRLASYICGYYKADDPYRSDFGRVISHAYLFRLPDAKPLWTVTGSDDAEHASWHKISELSSEEFHDDHFYIIQELLGL